MRHSDLSLNFMFLLLLVSYHHHCGTAEAQPTKQQQQFPYGSPTTIWDVPPLGVIVGAAIATFLLISIFLLFLRYYLWSESSKCEASIGIKPRLLKTFPILLYSSIMKHVKEGDEGTLPCAVCLAEFDNNDTIRVLPQCNHFFHPPCIDAWLSTHVTCPVCRTNLSGGCGIETV